MNDPEKEISLIVRQLCATDSPDVQKATLEKYMTSDVGFRHPVCEVKPGPNSRDALLGIFQWYRVLSPQVDIEVESVVFDPSKEVLYLEIIQWFKLGLLPLKPAPARLLTRLQLRKQAGLYYIAEQQDFYHTDEFAALLLPISRPFVRICLLAATFASNILVRGANLLGFWTTSIPISEPTPSEAGLYDKDD
ncbi:hypothetical protein CPB83DRAFT_910092 [Crepidotus variabilis]|uniref:SigF-like NTF2-like domain-containing protein n=1 Tax=Crepidotus variabilis TaxID=179855 RepID=A0A9P6E8C6_9AGAR|nr:hypothetical protein CPB83DRAFT_910092 [Crepidotus variabilis]